ncbi:OLC1v1025910C1 [Oldenlandia corymbosa var. corymbosa]|uniref:non-specific serine/threonine protein kinase n=1 Tax=Oldenlandia corymbosa var. corymbosa TaxID=529605 RepID=A0AAV1C7L4_OLDCO|nr:OLC1v1025910C1 [Oldenlandia corymbosa var. corymbosa]
MGFEDCNMLLSSAASIQKKSLLFLLLLLLLACCLGGCIAADTITITSPVRDSDTIVSSKQSFRLGFFSPPGSTDRYVGIMFNIPDTTTTIWVANRDEPLKDSKGVLSISEDGNLVILDGQNYIVWSSNVSNIVGNTSAQLWDTGDLVLKDSNGRTIWESFQILGDSLVSEMKLSAAGTKDKLQLTSWKSSSNPSVGSFRAGLNPSLIPEFFVWEGNKPLWRSGPWSGNAFIGIPGMAAVYQNRLDRVEGSVYVFNSVNNPHLFYYKLNSTGALQSKVFSNGDWNVTWSSQRTQCDSYGKCGPFAVCNPRTLPICKCLPGFVPNDDEEWKNEIWDGGCKREESLQCGRNQSDGFFNISNIKVPDLFRTEGVSEELCGDSCLQDCSCTAYAYYTGVGCMHWNGSLIDMQQFTYDGAVLHLRVPYSFLQRHHHGKKGHTKVVIAVSVTLAALLILLAAYICWKRLAKRRGKEKEDKIQFVESARRVESSFSSSIDRAKFEELPLYSYEALANATNNFGSENKLGTGGFGPVYMGKMVDGHKIAVKRLAKSSGQGIDEFMNEVVVISKLQHRNLVRLLGCCIERDEKMLVYEYMPNKSLDTYLFDPSKPNLLDWRKRVVIIEGICRGLLYLHRDSRLKIIHRDLKASNILLDEELKPKISDFGMARIFGGDEDQANTNRVVGTYGYMAPEYAMEGRFSEKSDVYSLGVLLLEIVSGRRNTTFYLEENELNLLRYAWKLWNENETSKLIDKRISDPGNETEILRYVHVGLLCVQEFPNDRPDVSAVLSMLNSEIAVLPPPNFPAYTERLCSSAERTGSSHSAYSMNNFSITVVEEDSTAIDTITITKPIQDPQSVVSSGQTYRLGFFSPENTSNRYVGIIMNVPELTVIWVANRDRPLKDSAGVVAISNDGNIVVLNGKNETLWSSNVSNPAANSSAQLLKTGNLVLRDNADGRSVWESFQIPTDSFVQTMKLGVTVKGKSLLTSWKSPDPSIGNFSMGFGPKQTPETFVWNNGKPYWRSGPWNGTVFIGIPGMYTAYINGLHMDANDDPTYLVLDKLSDSVDVYYVLNSSGTFLEMFYYEGIKGNPLVMWSSIESQCDFYGICGPFGLCNPLSSPICSCLQGFEPRDTDQWNRGNWTGGCLRKTVLQCGRNSSAANQDGIQDTFLKLSNVKVPDFYYVVDSMISNTEQKCGNQCSNNCTCIAYAFRRGIGCMHWSSGLLDMQQFDFDGSDLYVRVAYAVLDNGKSKRGQNAVISIIVIAVSLPIIGFVYFICKWFTKSRAQISKMRTLLAENEELHPYSYDPLANATNNFHSRNMLGKGGFGPVYKGQLTNGQEIAVKTLSNSTGQGNEEFMNEVLVISKLQHRNLVRLLGYCAEREEKILVYEYMPNKSLDSYLFEGISRGLLYLHRDSRLKIIHRDLKASNILLDAEFNPKISDFGLARVCRGNQDQTNTNRVVGTFGYMAPEYAMQGKFSEKSDVYSFGVLLLEILSGTRNISFYSAQNDLSLIGHAWKLWHENETAKFIDPRIFNEHNEMEISKYVHVGLLCVQEYAKDRPNMSSVLLMLNKREYSPQKGSIAMDTITISEPIQDPQSIVSSGKTYRLGFFSPVNTSYRYVGIMMNITELTVIWVANRDRPLKDSAGIVAISDDGNVVVLDGKKETLWSSNVSKLAANSSAQLLDTGNLVLRDNSDGRAIWESFQNPTDCFVKKMRLGWSVECLQSQCDIYGKCGPFGLCNPWHSPICLCLQGFEPRDKNEWRRGNWTGGCLRKEALQCGRNSSVANQDGKQDGFLKLSNIKVPDFSYVVDLMISSSREAECRNQCLNNCTCVAYVFSRGIGCMHWRAGLIDMQQFTFDGSDLYVRVAYSVLDDRKSKKDKRALISSIVIVLSLSFVGFLYFICKWFTKSRAQIRKMKTMLAGNEELHLYSYATLANATDNFHSRNMLGKGGFGPVYKGGLTNGQEIAVKCLSNSSTQGSEEFMNEVLLISKLQHRNLVRLLGCCAEREGKMLVYEYMPNKSLDAYLFDSNGQVFLDWKRRKIIIEGISRGLLYLHRDSRLKIIHRDLKTSNILLDAEFNPKISDFGLARTVGGNQDQANTNRIVGTYGYMAPEYAMQGKFSEKSDVYSFGVLLLEILSGIRNVSFYSAENDLSLVGHAWKLWHENETAKFIDPTIFDERNLMEVSRYIHIGLLCVQEYGFDRPNMASVLSMLNSEIAELPRPKLPAYARTMMCSSESVHSHQSVQSSNDVTITTLLGR